MESRFNPKTLIKLLIAVDILLILITAFICFRQSERVKRIYSQQAAERWESKDMDFTEVSVYYSNAKKAGRKNIEEIRNNIMKKLDEDSMVDVTSASSKRAFIDAYSGFTEMRVEKGDNQITGKIYGVSDDFFLIHPIPLLAGNYINPVEKVPEIGDGKDPYQIVLDENMAWNLFGSVDVEGMKVWINDKVFTIMGVVEASQNKTEEMAYGNFDAAFIPYAAFEAMKQEVSINCYEAVLPEPIKGYAKSTIAEATDIVVDPDEENDGTEPRSTLSFGDSEVVVNTDRFGVSALYKYLKNKKYMSMHTTEIAYPFWENVARFEVERASRVFKWCIALLVLPVLSVLALLGWLYHKRTVVFNATNKQKALDLLAELGEGIKEHFTKPTVENYDDDPEDDDEDAPQTPDAEAQIRARVAEREAAEAEAQAEAEARAAAQAEAQAAAEAAQAEVETAQVESEQPQPTSDGHTEQLFADMATQNETEIQTEAETQVLSDEAEEQIDSAVEETEEDSIELTTVDNGIVVNSEEETGNEE